MQLKSTSIFSFFLALACVIASSCSSSEQKEKPKSKSPRIKKQVKLTAPNSNEKFVVGSEILLSVAHKDQASIDSVVLMYGKKVFSNAGNSISWIPSDQRAGSPKIIITAYYGNTKETLYPKVIFIPESTPIAYRYRLINTFPHDARSYTQGLFFVNETLYESAGHRRESTMQTSDYKTGEIIQMVNLEDKYFGEGATLWNDKVYQITWESQTGFIYDKDLNQLQSFNYTGQGWGLATWGDTLLMSDGSERIYLINPVDFSTIDVIQVYDEKGKVTSLNELEVINGDLYANIYDSSKDEIVIIDLPSGVVKGKIDVNGLIDRNKFTGIDYVLNGIAIKDDGSLFVTHKWSPELYQIEIYPVDDNL